MLGEQATIEGPHEAGDQFGLGFITLAGVLVRVDHRRQGILPIENCGQVLVPGRRLTSL